MSRRITGPMTRAVKAAVKASTHLEPEDQAAVQVALQLAAVIDSAAAESDPAAWRKQVGWVAPHLNATLRSLALTPESRDLRDKHKPHQSDALERLRAKRAEHFKPQGDDPARQHHGSRLAEMRAVGATFDE